MNKIQKLQSAGIAIAGVAGVSLLLLCWKTILLMTAFVVGVLIYLRILPAR